MKETFYYDNLDRLDSVKKGVSNPTLWLDMAYDATKGGITTKTDVGTLLYNVQGKPYSPGSVNPSTGVIPPVLDSVTYTSFESVNTIFEGAYSATFVYNPENERAKMEIKQNGSTILTRWYLGSDYIKETSAGVTKEYSFIGGNAYTAPCVAVKQQGIPTRFYYLLRDHLGSVTGVTDSTGTILYQYSYDSWGRMRNVTLWEDYSPGSEPSLFVAGRGYTGHEHLPWFSAINMNGRLYDPLSGQFLSPDNNVQSPGFTQNLNRYSYCLNNPLKYTDPDGEFFIGTILTFIGDFLKTTLFHGGLSFNKDVRREAWKDFDPSASWSATNKAWKIDIGGFKTDPNRTIVGRGLQLLSRWTWELPQTLAGKTFSHTRNIFGGVDNVEYYGGATLVNRNNKNILPWGLTLGPYINSNRVVADPYTDDVFRHEYGHTLQSRLVGPLYLTSVAIPSGIGAFLDYKLHINNHDREWYETQANRMSERYFRNQDPGALDALPWDDNLYPRKYNPTWYWIFAHPPIPFMWWLFF